MPFETTVDTNDPKALADCCIRLRNEGGRGELEVIVRQPTRSARQNRRYWVAVVEPLSDWLTATEGRLWTKDDVHEFMKANFLPLREMPHPQTGELVLLPQSTRTLNKEDFNLLCDKGLELLEWLRNTNPTPRQLARR